jgi:hypothetical protein
MPALVIGIVLLVFGGLMATGVFHYTDTKRVVDAGPLKIDKTTEKTTPPNIGYFLLAGGLALVVIGAVTGKKE